MKEGREREAWVRGVTENRDKASASDDRAPRHAFWSRYLARLSGDVFTSMTRLTDGLHALAVTAWVGALWAIGLLAAPTLFAALPDRSIAGLVAGRMFLYVAVLGFICGAYLLLFRLVRFGGDAFRQGFFWLVLAMVLLSAAGEFAVQPVLAALKDQALPRQVMESVFRDRFAVWHGLASLVYLIQCGLGLVLVLSQDR
jgi:hypothetical protein